MRRTRGNGNALCAKATVKTNFTHVKCVPPDEVTMRHFLVIGVSSIEVPTHPSHRTIQHIPHHTTPKKASNLMCTKVTKLNQNRQQTME